jgi:hypothetical protein
MPRHLETFTTCAGPGVARPHTEMGGLAGSIISAWYFSGVLTIVGGLAFLAGLILATGPLGWCIAAAAVIVALVEIKHWYYNERLLCIGDPECAIGTVISEPTAAFDGDRKLNLMLAPFTQLEIRLALMSHLERNRAMLTDPANFTDGFHPSGPPTLPTAMQMSGNPSLLQNYMNELRGTDPSDTGGDSDMYNQIVIGVVDTLLLDSNVNAAGEPKNFLQRFYRMVAATIPDVATRNAIPTDQDSTVVWQNPDAKSNDPLNPMFRFDNTHTVPYLHCEIEGNYIEILLDDFIVALTAFTVGCSLGGPLVGAALGFLAWLFKKIWDWITGNDGDADEPDIDWDDPNFTGYDGVTEATGDVVVAHGAWIMDTEHHSYFEIHPVRAYYLIAKNALGSDAPVLVDGNEDQVVVGDNFDPTTVNAATANRICEIVAKAEAQDPDSRVPAAGTAALSYGMVAHYGGGGAIK